MKSLAIALSLSLLTASTAFACTPEELQAKATDLATQLQTLVATDIEKAGQISERLLELQSKQMEQSLDMDGACKLYDDMLAEIARAQ